MKFGKLCDQELLAEVTDRRGEESDKEEEINDNRDSDPISSRLSRKQEKRLKSFEKFQSVYTIWGGYGESLKGNKSRCGQGRAML